MSRPVQDKPREFPVCKPFHFSDSLPKFVFENNQELFERNYSMVINVAQQFCNFAFIHQITGQCFSFLLKSPLCCGIV